MLLILCARSGRHRSGELFMRMTMLGSPSLDLTLVTVPGTREGHIRLSAGSQNYAFPIPSTSRTPPAACFIEPSRLRKYDSCPLVEGFSMSSSISKTVRGNVARTVCVALLLNIKQIFSSGTSQCGFGVALVSKGSSTRSGIGSAIRGPLRCG